MLRAAAPCTISSVIWCLAPALIVALSVLSIGRSYLDGVQQLQTAEAHRLQREQDQQKEAEGRRRHELALEKPIADMLRDARGVIEASGDAAEKADAVVSQLDYEKLQVLTGAWKFTCNVSDVEASIRAKLSAHDAPGHSQYLPEALIDTLATSLRIDDEVVEHKGSSAVDGGHGESSTGHMYQVRLRSKSSRGKVSVALMAFSVSFDAGAAADPYEAPRRHTSAETSRLAPEQRRQEALEQRRQEAPEPWYLYDAPVPEGHVRTCRSRGITGYMCIFPFRYRGMQIRQCTLEGMEDAPRQASWCATATDTDGNIEVWDYCTSEDCRDEEVSLQGRGRKSVDMAETTHSAPSHGELPNGVTRADVMQALDVVVSRSAVEVLRG